MSVCECVKATVATDDYGAAAWCVRCGGRDPDDMTEGEMIAQGLREAVDWSREGKPDTQETGETDG